MNLATLQTEIQARLEADEWFTTITVLNERSKEIAFEIEQAIAALQPKGGKLGSFVVVAPFEADVESPDTPGPYFGALVLPVFVYESVVLNTDPTAGTLKPAIDTAVRVAQVCHHYRPEGLAENIFCDKNTIRPSRPPKDDLVAYRVNLRVPANMEPPTRVAPPVVSAPDGPHPVTASLSCATSGAAIYYTLDESHPWAGNPAAVLYSAPIVINAAAVLRAIAYKTGMIASDSALGLYS